MMTQTSSHEKTYSETARLISTTDLRGVITYANPVFCEVSGYSAEELIGQHHNLVRHPDMPKKAFADMWQHLKADKPWIGLVKNRCKNGDYYWVQAYVIPLFDENGQKSGYQSVRTRPTPESVLRAEKLYRILDTAPANKHAAKMYLSRQLNSVTAVFVVAMLALQLPLLTTEISRIGSVGLVCVAAVLLYIFSKKISGLDKETAGIYDSPLTLRILADSTNDVGRVQLGLKVMRAKLRTLVGRIEDTVTTIYSVMESTQAAVTATKLGIEKQNHETDMLASATEQMAVTAQEIARNTVSCSHSAEQAVDEAEQGKDQLTDLIQSVEELSKIVLAASESSTLLQEQTLAIGQVVTTIDDIAAQTNLLALNAAIEAARAGEQGRGFAVVADEVRNLSKRTQDATLGISKTIEDIQQLVSQTNEKLDQSHKKSAEGVAQASIASNAFDTVNRAISEILDATHQIAAAAEQQSTACTEVSNNTQSIRSESALNLIEAEKTQTATRNLGALVSQLQSSTKSFDIK